ncbi:MAG: hypothetical protein WCY18_00365 [Methanofastidiosum sp.]
MDRDDRMHEKYNYFGDIIYKINILKNSLGILESDGLEVSEFKDELDSIYCEISNSIKTQNYDPHLRNKVLREYISLKRRVFTFMQKQPQII